MQHAIVDSKETVEFSFCKLDSFLDMSKTTSKQKTIKLFEENLNGKNTSKINSKCLLCFSFLLDVAYRVSFNDDIFILQ